MVTEGLDYQQEGFLPFKRAKEKQNNSFRGMAVPRGKPASANCARVGAWVELAGSGLRGAWAAGACSGLARSPLSSLLSGGSPVENSELQLETTCLETEDVPLKEKSQCLSAQMTVLGRYLLFSCASSRVFMGCYQGKCRNNACFCLGFNLNYRWPGSRCRPGRQPPWKLDFVRAWRLGGVCFFFPSPSTFWVLLSRAAGELECWVE